MRFQQTETWCTGYALSIYGDFLQNRQCPFNNGNGYGDGRAISIGEVLLDNGKRWDFQLKGGGRTPYCRGADGRAVLRSSVREFLASEAMHHLGVRTTRAISLCVSGSLTADRPWYSNRNAKETPDLNDPRLSQFPMAFRKQLLEQLKQETRQPDMMQTESCAITCRVAPSFLRIGHVELFGRRAAQGNQKAKSQLESLLGHALSREYPDVEGASLGEKVLGMLRLVSRRLVSLTTGWIRVGFCQGNFNSDNCLISGTTMDYGPFGWVEAFGKFWNMWAGSGDHFGFLNQSVAGGQNLKSLVEACAPVFDASQRAVADEILTEYDGLWRGGLASVWCSKLGLESSGELGEEGKELVSDCLDMMEELAADYTTFWRQLGALALAGKTKASSDDDLLDPMTQCFRSLSTPSSMVLLDWLRRWLGMIEAQTASRGEIGAAMNRANPKYVPREWMLVEAYTMANNGDYSMLHELHELFSHPYDEQPEREARYYNQAPPEVAHNGGLAFMS